MNSKRALTSIPLEIEVYINYNIQYTRIVLFITLIVIVFVKVYLDHKSFITILISFTISIIILLNRGKSFILLIFG